MTLADLGARAAAKEGRLVISMADGDPYSGSMFTGSGPIVSPDMTVATRPPRRSMSSPAKGVIWRAKLLMLLPGITLTGDNGFLDNAQYDTYLNGATSYLDTGVVSVLRH